MYEPVWSFSSPRFSATTTVVSSIHRSDPPLDLKANFPFFERSPGRVLPTRKGVLSQTHLKYSMYTSLLAGKPLPCSLEDGPDPLLTRSSVLPAAILLQPLLSNSILPGEGVCGECSFETHKGLYLHGSYFL